jgi:hypothetical protein
MKLKKGSLLFSTLTLVTLFAFTFSAITHGGNDSQGIEQEIKILQIWSGDYPVSQLDFLPEAQNDSPVGIPDFLPKALHNSPVGIIDNEFTFGHVWLVFKPGEDVPVIDFKVNLVLYVRNTQFYNRINIGKVKLENGVAEIVSMETLSARPIEDKVAMSLVVVPRKGITGLKSGDTVIPVPELK